jgi:hypothetical protein
MRIMLRKRPPKRNKRYQLHICIEELDILSGGLEASVGARFSS